MVTWIPYSTMPNKKNNQKAQKSRKQSMPGNRQGASTVAPVALATSMRNTGPMLHERNRKRERIHHCELVTTVSGSTAYTVTPYPLNPGLPGTFPWLSEIAQRWEQYHFRKLKFYYVTRSGTDRVGSIILAPDYDASDSAPSSEVEITAYSGAVEDAVWKNIECPLVEEDMFPLGPRKFVRDGILAGDIKTYDVSTFYVATLEEADTSQIGKLWVEYDVEFFVPQLSPSSDSGPSSTSYYAGNSSQTLATGVAEPVEIPVAFDPLSFGAQTAGVWSPPTGVYKFIFQGSFQDATLEQFTVNLVALKNGAAVASTAVAIRTPAAASGSEQVSASLAFILGFTQGDTFAIQVTATGAAGVLTVLANTARLIVCGA